MAKKKTDNKKNGASENANVGAILLRKWWITALVIIFVLGGIILLYIFLPVVANKSESRELIKIPANATTEMVRDTLAKYYGEKYADKVVLASKLHGSDFSRRHGAYMVDSGLSPLNTERLLSTGAQHPMVVVINNARGVDILSERIAKNLDFSADSLSEQLKDSELLAQYDLKPSEALALFLDDSYQVYWNSSPKTVTEKIGANYKKIWNQERLDKAKHLGLTPAEVITLASIVDEETNKADEKPVVARLYLNRLKKGMKLQADPTVKFAVGDFSLRRIRAEHLKVDSPYNTYQVNGLPPGPIRTVTVKDIDAVLNAPSHDYIYMCAKDDFSGYHNFAKDYNTHMQNARKYQKALNRRNIL
ncbi:MAG: endolytic transglycosylase MltG [Muribaculaceae bacterium]|nr:endolytic transglycosylase MltG [Muribaculaceae bacterium]